MKHFAYSFLSLGLILSCNPRKYESGTKGSGMEGGLAGCDLACLTAQHQKYEAALRAIPILSNYEKKLQNEDKIIEYFISEFGKKQDRHVPETGKRDRGTHAKGTCFQGIVATLSKQELESLGYDSALISALKQGVFAASAEYSAQVRFSNAEGFRRPDAAADVRGFAISLNLNGGDTAHSGESKQDFISNNSEIFPVKDLADFVDFFKIVTFAETKNPAYVPNPFKLPTIKSAGDSFGKYVRNDVKSYANETYWSNVPAVHGLNENGTAKNISKFRMVPCVKKFETIASNGLPQNYLQEQLVSDVNEGSVCFLFQFQFFNEQKLSNHFASVNAKAYEGWSSVDWIENSGNMIWPEAVLPYCTVAKVYIPKGTAPVTCENRAVNSRLHSTKDHTPIGSLARGRALVEEGSRFHRLKDVVGTR